MKITIDLTYRDQTIDAYQFIVLSKTPETHTIKIKVDEIIDKATKNGAQMKQMAKALTGLVRKRTPKKPRLAKPTKKKDPRK